MPRGKQERELAKLELRKVTRVYAGKGRPRLCCCTRASLGVLLEKGPPSPETAPCADDKIGTKVPLVELAPWVRTFPRQRGMHAGVGIVHAAFFFTVLSIPEDQTADWLPPSG